jgi:hypothetical protein
MNKDEQVIELIKNIKSVFPESEVIVETPNREKTFHDFIMKLKKEGISGVWRLKPNLSSFDISSKKSA